MSNFQSGLEEEYAKIAEEFSCSHIESELRKRTIKGGSTTYVKQCVLCGNTSQPIKKEAALAFNNDEIPSYDDTLQDKWSSRKSEKYRQTFESSKKERVVEYHEYLDTVDWEGLRKKVFSRSKGLCEGCLEKEATQVHHLTYAHIGKEFLWELVAVCDECHERYHEED